MSDFAKNLRIYRKRKGYSQQELARKLHYGYTAISGYENGRNEPSIDDLMKLAEALEVTIENLIGVKPRNVEEKLISSFRRLGEKNKNRILDLTDALLN